MTYCYGTSSPLQIDINMKKYIWLLILTLSLLLDHFSSKFWHGNLYIFDSIFSVIYVTAIFSLVEIFLNKRNRLTSKRDWILVMFILIDCIFLWIFLDSKEAFWAGFFMAVNILKEFVYEMSEPK